MNQQKLIAVPIIFLLQACGTTDPGSAAAISYTMPKTSMKASVAVDIINCMPNVVSNSLFTMSAEAGSQTQPYKISGSLLKGAMTKRNLAITTYDNGVISTVNSTNTDQTSVALGAGIKIAGALLPLLAANKTDDGLTLKCRPAILEAVNNVLTLKKINTKAQQSILDQEMESVKIPQQENGHPVKQGHAQPHLDIAELQKTIDARSIRIANLQASLHAIFNADIILDRQSQRRNSYLLEWDIEGIQKYFDIEYVRRGPPPSEKQRKSDLLSFFETRISVSDVPFKSGIDEDTPTNLAECKQSILIPDAKPITVTLTPTGKLFAPIKGRPLQNLTQTIYAAQLSEPTTLCLSTKFGESRVVSLKFDKFGRTSEFTWSADSKVANSTSAVAGYSSDTTAAVKAFRSADLTKDKVELDELTTKRALQKARLCDAVIEAGGTTCPN